MSSNSHSIFLCLCPLVLRVTLFLCFSNIIAFKFWWKTSAANWVPCTYYYLIVNFLSFLIWKIRMIDNRVSKTSFLSKILVILFLRLLTLIWYYYLGPSCFPWSFFNYCRSLDVEWDYMQENRNYRERIC